VVNLQLLDIGKPLHDPLEPLFIQEHILQEESFQLLSNLCVHMHWNISNVDVFGGEEGGLQGKYICFVIIECFLGEGECGSGEIMHGYYLFEREHVGKDLIPLFAHSSQLQVPLESFLVLHPEKEITRAVMEGGEEEVK